MGSGVGSHDCSRRLAAVDVRATSVVDASGSEWKRSIEPQTPSVAMGVPSRGSGGREHCQTQASSGSVPASAAAQIDARLSP
jgi:hypothetical protein